MSDVVIIGAGITGLSCAWWFKRFGIECTVLESSDRVGGVIRSEVIGGYLVEHGPNSLLPSAESFALLDGSGLTQEMIEGDPKAPRYICLNRSLKKVPFGPMSLGGLARAAWEPFVRSRSRGDESISEFFTRRVGVEAHDRLVAPFVTGIYGGNTRDLSVSATFPGIVQLERDYGSLVLGMLRKPRRRPSRRGRTSSFRQGMEALPRRLAESTRVLFGANDLRIQRNLEIHGPSHHARPKAVVVTAPAHRVVGIVEQSLPNVARLLENVDYAPMVIAASSVADSDLPKPLRGFGFLVPRSEKLHILGTLFSSALFPDRAPQGRQLFTTFIGGAFEREACEWPDERIWETVQSELKTILKLSNPPDPVRLIRHRYAIPQYRIGHDSWREKLRNELACAPGLFLTGNYLDGVSVASCLESGERTARAVMTYLGSKS